LKSRFQERVEDTQRKIGIRNSLQKEIKDLEGEREGEEKKIAVLERVVALFNTLGEDSQRELYKKIETIVSYGLRTVFGEDYDFRIVSEVKGKQSTTRFFINVKGAEVDIFSAKGGGMVCVVGFILQVLTIVFMKDNVRQLLIMDEGLTQLSETYRQNMADVMKKLCEKLGLQIIFVTHQNDYVEVADTVYKFQQNKRDFTEVTKLK